MIKILYTTLPEELSDEVLEGYLKGLPELIQERAKQFIQLQDQYAYVFGRFLLKEGFESFGNGCTLNRILYTSHNRPYIKGSSLDFNVSHSGNYIIAAFAEGMRVGIDIEEIRPIKLENFSKLFSKNEWLQITSSLLPLQSFFYLWTQKESIMKADGRGFSLAPAEILIQDNKGLVGQESWYLKQLDINPDFACYLSSDKIPEKVNFKQCQY